VWFSLQEGDKQLATTSSVSNFPLLLCTFAPIDGGIHSVWPKLERCRSWWRRVQAHLPVRSWEARTLKTANPNAPSRHGNVQD